MPMILRSEGTYNDENTMRRLRYGHGLNKRNKIHYNVRMHNGGDLGDILAAPFNWVSKNKPAIKDTMEVVGDAVDKGAKVYSTLKGKGIVLNDNLKLKRGGAVDPKFTAIIRKADKLKSGSGLYQN